PSREDSMTLRTTLTLTLAIFALLVIVGTIWKMPTPPSSAKPRELDYSPPRDYVCCRLTEPIVIDGKLDDPAWRAIPWTDDFVDIEGDKRPRPPLRTRAKMAWD